MGVVRVLLAAAALDAAIVAVGGRAVWGGGAFLGVAAFVAGGLMVLAWMGAVLVVLLGPTKRSVESFSWLTSPILCRPLFVVFCLLFP